MSNQGFSFNQGKILTTKEIKIMENNDFQLYAIKKEEDNKILLNNLLNSGHTCIRNGFTYPSSILWCQKDKCSNIK